jgi:hypothetical protein
LVIYLFLKLDRASSTTSSARRSSALVNGHDDASDGGEALEKARKLRKELAAEPVIKPRAKDYSSSTPVSSRDTSSKVSAPKAVETVTKEASPVSTEPKTQAPLFTQKLRSQKVKEGASLMLEVRITAIPEAKVQWFKDGNDVSQKLNS